MGEFAAEEFEGGEAEDVAVDGGHAVEPPVFAGEADGFVDALALGDAAADELFHETVGRELAEVVVFAVEGVVESVDGGLGFIVADIAQEENLQRAFARFSTAGHGELDLGAPEGAEEVGHFDSGMGGFSALVAHFAAGAVQGLFHGVGGEDTVGDGDAGFAADAGEAFGVFAGDVIKVRGIAPDDATEGDDGVAVAAAGEFASEDGHFPSAGDTVDGEVVLGEAGAAQGIEGAFEETVSHEAVEAAHHHGHTQAGGEAAALLNADFMGVEGGHVGY